MKSEETSFIEMKKSVRNLGASLFATVVSSVFLLSNNRYYSWQNNPWWISHTNKWESFIIVFFTSCKLDFRDHFSGGRHHSENIFFRLFTNLMIYLLYLKVSWMSVIFIIFYNEFCSLGCLTKSKLNEIGYYFQENLSK